jgi:hypothetical protein
MIMIVTSHKLTMHETAVYRIRLQGAFDESWKQYLDWGWTIQFDDDSASETMTLTGAVRDQAALIGLLSSLYDVGLPLLEVECLETGAGQRPFGVERAG